MLENETKVAVDTLLDEAERLRKQGVRFATATGLDEGDHFKVIYHFILNERLQHLRLSVPKDVSVPSISGVFPGAFLIENEMKELLGIDVTNISIDYGGKLFMVEGVAGTPLAKSAVYAGPISVSVGGSASGREVKA